MDDLGIQVRDGETDPDSLEIKAMYKGGGARPIHPSDTKVENTNPKLRLDTDVVSLSGDRQRQWKLRDTSWESSKTMPSVVPASPEIHGTSRDPFKRLLKNTSELSKCFHVDSDGEWQIKRMRDITQCTYESCTDLHGKTGKNVSSLDDDKDSAIHLRDRDKGASLADEIKLPESNPLAAESDVVDLHGYKRQQFNDVAGIRQPNEDLTIAELLDLPTPQVVTDGVFFKPKPAEPALTRVFPEKVTSKTFSEPLEDEGQFCSAQNEKAEEDFSVEDIPKIGAKLGEGGQGTVVLGILPGTEQLAAVKQVWVSKGDAALWKEYEIAMKLNGHPNIIEVYKAERKGDSFFTYMEYMKDGAVNEWEWTDEQVVYILQEVLEGLVHMHELGIIHRDIKGENVLISFDDDKKNIKIADLGSAVCAPWNGNGYGDVEDYGYQGTVPFISKEVARGQKFSLASDIWAVGCLGIELLTGELPWSEFNLRRLALQFKIGNTETPPPIPPDISDSLQDFLSYCLQMDPRDRPSASKLLQHPLFDEVEE